MHEETSFKYFFNDEDIAIIQGNPFVLFNDYPACFNFIYALWKHNFSKIGFEDIPDKLFNIIKTSSNLSNNETLNNLQSVFDTHREFKRHARRSRRFGIKMNFGLDLLKPYLTEETNQFLDFGCGKMALIRRLTKEITSIKRFYGYDPASNPGEANFDQRVEFINKIEELKKISSIDLVHSSFVFHHLTDSEIADSLKIIHNVLNKNGIFIFIEESFSQSNVKKEVSVQKLKDLGYLMNENLTGMFEEMSTKEKFLAIYLNDVLINLKNLSYMPWTFEYKTLEEWRSLIEEAGFKTINEYSFGIVQNDRLKQGLTSLQVFKKIE